MSMATLVKLSYHSQLKVVLPPVRQTHDTKKTHRNAENITLKFSHLHRSGVLLKRS